MSGGVPHTRQILAVAFPLMVGSFASFIVNFIDMAFLGHLGTYPEWNDIAQNAAGNGGLLLAIFFMTAYGYASGLQIKIANYRGLNKLKEVGHLFHQALWTQLALGIFFVVLLFLVLLPFFKETMTSAVTYEAMKSYVLWRLPGFPFLLLQGIFIAFYTGIERTRILLTTTLLTATVNIGFDYALIFGHWGFPALQIQGAALASSLAEFSGFAYLLFAVNKSDKAQYALLKRHRLSLKESVKQLKFSLPLMSKEFLSLGAWAVYFFMIEQMGAFELNVSQQVRNYYFLIIIPVMGFGSATRSFISRLKGEGNIVLIPKTIKRLCLLSFIAMLLLVQSVWFYPEVLIGMITENAKNIDKSAEILRFISLAMLIFSVAFILLSAIQGLGKTRLSFRIELLTIVIYLLGTYLVIQHWQASIKEVWAMEYVYFGLLSICTLLYLIFGNWKNETSNAI